MIATVLLGLLTLLPTAEQAVDLMAALRARGSLPAGWVEVEGELRSEDGARPLPSGFTWERVGSVEVTLSLALLTLTHTHRQVKPRAAPAQEGVRSVACRTF